MEKKRRLVDWIVAKATWGRFTGDERDGKAPPITVENFTVESYRYAAKSLRARLSRLSSAKLLAEARAVRAHLKKKPSELAQLAERAKRDEDARAHRQRQAEFAKKPRVESAIVAAIIGAARHYRNQRMTADKAWVEIKKNPFHAENGYIVKIEGSKDEQRMCVISPDGTQLRRFGSSQWRQHYWPAASQPAKPT
jgi:hypothetical protein